MKTGFKAYVKGIIKNNFRMITALIIIGALAIILTVLTYFTSFSEISIDTTSTIPLSINTPEFYTAVESIVGSTMLPLTKNDSIKILNNGDEFVPDLLSEIKGAKKSVTLANYIWKSGDLMDSVFGALTAKAKEGVAVRIIMDGSGSFNRPKDKIEELTKAGGVVEIFRPISIRTITRINKRSHIRAMVIDGKTGYIGGFAFRDEWLGNGLEPEEWRDIMFKVAGLPARSIQNIFNDLWRQTNGEILSGEDFYPTFPPVIVGENVCEDSCFVGMFHSPTPDLEKNLSQLIWLSSMGAKKHIHIETPYLLPDQNILNALKKKVAEGVDVEIIVPGPYIDSKTVQWASKSYYLEVLNAGIKIYEYQPAHLHSKIFTADNEWSIVGSPNLDNRSSTLNAEGALAIEDISLAKNIEAQFEIDKSRSVLVDKETFKENWSARIMGKISRLFSKQY